MPAFGSFSTPPETVSDLEVRQIIDNLPPSDSGIRAKAMILMMYRCGMRKGEVLSLRPSRITLSSANPYIQIRGAKYGKGRNVPVDLRIIEDLRIWEMIRPPAGEYYFCTLKQNKDNGISKGNPIGSQLSHGVINTTIREAAKKAGIDRRIWPHMFRHSCATNWLRDGIPLEHIRVLLGHANISVTQRYMHASSKDLEQSVYGLSKDHNAPLPEGLVECPECAEHIKAKARKCHYCSSTIKQSEVIRVPHSTRIRMPKAAPFSSELVQRIDISDLPPFR